MMDRKPPRFTLADILLLVVATALSLAGLRLLLNTEEFRVGAFRGALPSHKIVEMIVLVVSPFLIAWTLLVFLQILRRPWPSIRPAVSRPGFLACAVTSLVLLDSTLHFAIRTVKYPHSIAAEACNGLWNLTDRSGLLILGSWLALALGGRLRPGPTWMDRFGFLLGCSWLALSATYHFYFSIILPLLS